MEINSSSVAPWRHRQGRPLPLQSFQSFIQLLERQLGRAGVLDGHERNRTGSYSITLAPGIAPVAKTAGSLRNRSG